MMKIIFKFKEKLTDKEKQDLFKILKIIRPQGAVITEVDRLHPITFEIEDQKKFAELINAIWEKNFNSKIKLEVELVRKN